MRAAHLSSRLVFIGACLAGLALVPVIALGQPATVQRLPRALGAIAELIARDASGHEVSRGVAVFTDIGRAVVNGRLLHGASDAVIRHGGRESQVTAVIGEDKGSGLAMLAVDLPDGAPPSLPPDAARSTATGTLFGLSAERGACPVQVSAAREVAALGLVAKVESADGLPDGSPLVDASGNLVGLLLVLQGQQGSLAVMIPSSRLARIQGVMPQRVSEWTGRTEASAKPSAEPRFVDGVTAVLSGKDAVAAEQFRAAATARATDAESWRALARSEASSGHIEEAASAYRQALSLRPSDASIHHELGLLLLDHGHGNEALVELTEVTKLHPQDPEAHFNLGAAAGLAGRYDVEYAEYQRALGLDRSHFKSLKNLAVVCLVMKRAEESAAASERALSMSPSDAEVATNLGAAYVDLKEYEKAKASFSQALRFHPDFSPAHFGLGVVHLLRGNRAAAVAEGETLKHLDPTRSHRLLQLATQDPH